MTAAGIYVCSSCPFTTEDEGKASAHSKDKHQVRCYEQDRNYPKGGLKMVSWPTLAFPIAAN